MSTTTIFSGPRATEIALLMTALGCTPKLARSLAEARAAMARRAATTTQIVPSATTQR